MVSNYPVEFKINNQSRFCIWHTGITDEFITVQSNKIICFNSFNDLKKYCCKANYKLSNDLETYDIDYFCNWLQTDKNNVDCSKFLNFWNISADLAHSVDDLFYGDENGLVLDVYNKLFYGTNPAALKNEAEADFTPDWDSESLGELVKVIKDCIRIIELYTNI